MELSKLASAIYNDIVSGLAGHNAEPTISLEQLEDEVAEERCAVVKEMHTKNLLDKKDLMVAINCIDVDCADPSKCCNVDSGERASHFEIPQLMDGLGEDAISYIGSTDRTEPIKFYFSPSAIKYAKYRNRGKNKPYIYIEKTPNENNMYDGWIYNAPFIKHLTITGIFKDLRQLEEFTCCNTPDFTEFGTISSEVKRRLVEKKIKLYRQYLAQPQPNDLIAK